MSFLQNLGQRFMAFMSGRNGVDQLTVAGLIGSLLLQVLGSLLGSPLLLIISFAAYGFTVFRVFSKKSYKREEENRKFCAWWENVKTKTVQFFKRLKLSRQYKYFKCPQCKALLRMSRGEGEKEICCPKCQNRFKQKS